MNIVAIVEYRVRNGVESDKLIKEPKVLHTGMTISEVFAWATRVTGEANPQILLLRENEAFVESKR